jgi:hypothetical protein
LWSPLFAGVIAIVAILRFDQWAGIWPQTSMTVQLGTALATPLIAAASAWAAYQRATARLEEQLSSGSIHPWAREAPPVLAALAASVLAPLIAFGVLAVISAPTAGQGAIWPTFMLLTVSQCGIAVGYGYLMGRLVPSPISAAGAGFSTAVFVFAGSDSGHWALMTLNGYATVSISWWALGVRLGLASMALLLAIGVGATMKLAPRSGFQRVRQWGSGLAALVAMLILFPLAGPLQAERDSLGYEECTDTYPTVCLWPEHRKYLPQAAEYARRFNDLSEFLALPDDPYMGQDRFYEQGIRGDVGDQITLFGGGFGIANGMISYAEYVTGFPGCTPQEWTPQWDVTAGNLHDWFIAYLMEADSTADFGITGITSEQLDQVLSMPDGDQFAWAREQVEELGRLCAG